MFVAVDPCGTHAEIIWLPKVRRLLFPALNLERGTRCLKAGKEGRHE